MDARLTKQGLIVGGIGAAIQAAAYAWAVWRTTPHLSVLEYGKYPIGAITISIAGSIMLIAGLAFYAQAKGHTRWCALMGCFGLYSVLGFYVLALSSDRRAIDDPANEKRRVMTGDRVWLIALAAVPISVVLPAFGIMLSLLAVVAGIAAFFMPNAYPDLGGKKAAITWMLVGGAILALQIGTILILGALAFSMLPDQN